MIKERLFTNWHLMRWFQLGMGIYVGIHAWQSHSALSAFFSALFLFQAYTNTGCCGNNGCATAPQKMSVKKETEEVEYEEVK